MTDPNTQAPPAKKPVSEKQLIANQNNARLSTGPITPEGKLRASMNGLVHGMRSAKSVLAGESQEAYDARMARWTVDLQASGDAQRYAVARAVDASWRTERGEAAQDARATRRMHDVVEGAERRDKQDAERLIDQLPDQPSLIDEVLSTPAGVRLVRDELVILAERLHAGKRLLKTQRDRCLWLLGKTTEYYWYDDPVTTRWLRAFVGATFGDQATPEQIGACLGGKKPAVMSQVECDIRINELKESLPSQAEGTALVKEYLAAEIARLDALLPEVEALAERNLALDVEAARSDSSIDGTRLSSQIQAADRSYHSALRQVRWLQNPSSRRGPGRPPKNGKPPDGPGGSAPDTTAARPESAGAPPAQDVTAAGNPGTCPPGNDTSQPATNLEQRLETTARNDADLGCLESSPPQDDAATSRETVAQPLGSCPMGGDTTQPGGVSTSEPILVADSPGGPEHEVTTAHCPPMTTDAFAEPAPTLALDHGQMPAQETTGITTSEPILVADSPGGPEHEVTTAHCPPMTTDAFAERTPTLALDHGQMPAQETTEISTSEPILVADGHAAPERRFTPDNRSPLAAGAFAEPAPTLARDPGQTLAQETTGIIATEPIFDGLEESPGLPGGADAGVQVELIAVPEMSLLEMLFPGVAPRREFGAPCRGDALPCDEGRGPPAVGQ
jgi:hypothetical protein